MSAPKNYTVRGMEKDPRFWHFVAEISQRHPHWKIRDIRDEAARRVFAAKIADAKENKKSS